MVDLSEWRVIDGFPDYEVRADGRVRTWRRKARVWRNPLPGRLEHPVELTGTVTPFGYTAFILRDAAGAVKRRFAHRLVGLAFLPPPTPGQTDISHNDGNPGHNHVHNLRWATHRENQMDMRRHGTMQDGERSITAKITAEDASFIRAAVASGPRGTQRRMMERFGLSAAHVHRIAKGMRWSAL